MIIPTEPKNPRLRRRATPSPSSHKNRDMELPDLKRRFCQPMEPNVLSRGRDVTTEGMFRITRLGPVTPEEHPCSRSSTSQNDQSSRSASRRPRLMNCSSYKNLISEETMRARERVTSRLIPGQVEPVESLNSPELDRYLDLLQPLPYVEGRFIGGAGERQIPGVTRQGIQTQPQPTTIPTRPNEKPCDNHTSHEGPCRFQHHNMCDGRARMLEARERRLLNQLIPDDLQAYGENMFNEEPFQPKTTQHNPTQEIQINKTCNAGHHDT